MKIESGARANFVGSIWMVLAMAAFALEDAAVKAASRDLPVWQVLVLFGTGGAIIFGVWIAIRGDSFLNPDARSKPMLIRVFFEIIGRLFYILALALIPLSATTAILQATPIVVVAGAALLFGEKVGWRRWTAICIGFVGVLIVLKPTPESFSVLSLMAVIGMVGFAGRDLASRAAPATLSIAQLGFYGFLSIILAGVLFAFWERLPPVWPSPWVWMLFVMSAVWGVIAYYGLMRAMRTGSVAAVTPFRYTRLLFGIGLGVALFGERPDASMLVGCAIIVASGLFILSRSGSENAG